VLAAFRDGRLKRRDLRVYATAIETLSFYVPLQFKVRVVARQTGLHYADAARSIRRLTVTGYLERARNDGAIHTYLVRMVPPSTDRAA
jgi:DNA-binding IclR family transcriptional regulator